MPYPDYSLGGSYSSAENKSVHSTAPADWAKKKMNHISTFFEGDSQAPFSIATTPRRRGGRYFFTWIAPLYPWSLPYNAECYARRHQVSFLCIWYNSTWDWTKVSRTVGEPSTHWSQWSIYICIYVYIFLCVWVCVCIHIDRTINWLRYKIGRSQYLCYMWLLAHDRISFIICMFLSSDKT